MNDDRIRAALATAQKEAMRQELRLISLEDRVQHLRGLLESGLPNETLSAELDETVRLLAELEPLVEEHQRLVERRDQLSTEVSIRSERDSEIARLEREVVRRRTRLAELCGLIELLDGQSEKEDSRCI